jgi:hypothetical protein
VVRIRQPAQRGCVERGSDRGIVGAEGFEKRLMKIVRKLQSNTMRIFILIFIPVFWAASNVAAQNTAQYNLAQSIETLSFNQDQLGLRKDGTFCI